MTRDNCGETDVTLIRGELYRVLYDAAYRESATGYQAMFGASGDGLRAFERNFVSRTIIKSTLGGVESAAAMEASSRPPSGWMCLRIAPG